MEETAEYWGESAFCGSYRIKQHQEDVEGKKESNAFFKHLKIFHPENEGGTYLIFVIFSPHTHFWANFFSTQILTKKGINFDKHQQRSIQLQNFDIQVQSVHKKSFTRQKTEAVKILSSTADHLLNSKAEHRQPALLRVRMTRENEEDNIPGQGGGRRGAHQQARRRRGN